MSDFDSFPFQTSLEVLIVADVDLISSSALVEGYSMSDVHCDMILLCGPVCYRECETPEQIASVQGDISAIVAQLENIVCRVCILGSELDPSAIVTEQLHLTPNSVNIHGRSLSLSTGLSLLGFTETSGNLVQGKLPEDVDRSADSDEELEAMNVRVESSLTSVELINDLLDKARSENEGGRCIFAFHQKYPHTLNHLLFHMPEKLKDSGVSLLVTPPVATTSEGEAKEIRLPPKLGSLSIASPGSLRRNGEYCTVTLKRTASGASATTWEVHEVKNHNLVRE
jgi:hypothetical protein